VVEKGGFKNSKTDLTYYRVSNKKKVTCLKRMERINQSKEMALISTPKNVGSQIGKTLPGGGKRKRRIGVEGEKMEKTQKGKSIEIR